MCPYTYYEIMRNSKDKRQIRYQIVVSANKKGVKPTAREFGTTVKTVRRWRDRFEKEGYGGLVDKAKTPKVSPKKTRKELEEKILWLKKKYKRMSAEQIKILEDIEVSAETMKRIWRKKGINNRRRRKHETKRNLREIKKKLNFMEMVCEDTKELKDIPEYYPTMMRNGTPKEQYTFRDVTTGMMYLGFANSRGLSESTLFAEYINQNLTKLGVSLRKTTRQTDNGSEYIGSWNAKESSSYTKEIESIKGQKHVTIPPRRHRWQADVETVHDIIEREWYEIESFTNRTDFMAKAYAYQLYFNLKRINTYKEKKTPWQLAKEKVNNLDMRVAMIPPIDLDALLKKRINKIYKGGSHVLTYPLPEEFSRCKALYKELVTTVFNTTQSLCNEHSYEINEAYSLFVELVGIRPHMREELLVEVGKIMEQANLSFLEKQARRFESYRERLIQAGGFVDFLADLRRFTREEISSRVLDRDKQEIQQVLEIIREKLEKAGHQALDIEVIKLKVSMIPEIKDNKFVITRRMLRVLETASQLYGEEYFLEILDAMIERAFLRSEGMSIVEIMSMPSQLTLNKFFMQRIPKIMRLQDIKHETLEDLIIEDENYREFLIQIEKDITYLVDTSSKPREEVIELFQGLKNVFYESDMMGTEEPYIIEYIMPERESEQEQYAGWNIVVDNEVEENSYIERRKYFNGLVIHRVYRHVLIEDDEEYEEDGKEEDVYEKILLDIQIQESGQFHAIELRDEQTLFYRLKREFMGRSINDMGRKFRKFIIRREFFIKTTKGIMVFKAFHKMTEKNIGTNEEIISILQNRPLMQSL